MKVSYDCRPAPQHVMSWHLGQIRRGAVHVAGVPTTIAHGPADHAYEVAASAEDPASRVGRSRPIASFGLFHRVLPCVKGLMVSRHCIIHCTLPLRSGRTSLIRPSTSFDQIPGLRVRSVPRLSWGLRGPIYYFTLYNLGPSSSSQPDKSETLSGTVSVGSDNTLMYRF